MKDTCLAIADTVSNWDCGGEGAFGCYSMLVFFVVIIAYYIYDDYKTGWIDENDIIPTSKKPKK